MTAAPSSSLQTRTDHAQPHPSKYSNDRYYDVMPATAVEAAWMENDSLSSFQTYNTQFALNSYTSGFRNTLVITRPLLHQQDPSPS